jgi:hypothetical protein
MAITLSLPQMSGLSNGCAPHDQLAPWPADPHVQHLGPVRLLPTPAPAHLKTVFLLGGPEQVLAVALRVNV